MHFIDRSTINLAPLTDRHHEHDEPVILDGGNYAIVIDPVAPESLPVSC